MATLPNMTFNSISLITCLTSQDFNQNFFPSAYYFLFLDATLGLPHVTKQENEFFFFEQVGPNFGTIICFVPSYYALT